MFFFFYLFLNPISLSFGYIWVIDNTYEDTIQAEAAACQVADIIAVICTTGKSLLDYVPYGITTEGFGGTYATQAKFKIVREAIDHIGEELDSCIGVSKGISPQHLPSVCCKLTFHINGCQIAEKNFENINYNHIIL